MIESNDIKLTVCVPTYNSARCVKRAIESVVRQTFTNWELLVMDACSEDDTIKIAESFSDDRIIIHRGKDKGVYDAMNKCISMARGEWLYFLGSDDWLMDDYVLERVMSCQNGDADVLYGKVESEVITDDKQGEWSVHDLFTNRCHQAIFYKKNVFDHHAKYNLKYKVYADYDLNLRLFADKTLRWKYVDVRIAHFSSGGMSSNVKDDLFFDKFYRFVLVNFWKELSKEERLVFLNRAVERNAIGKKILSLYRRIK